MAVDMFMKIQLVKVGVVKGESRDKTHADEIDVLSWNWGMTNPRDAATGLSSGRTQVHNFTFRKPIDKSSPVLANAILNNDELVKAILTCRKEGRSGGEKVEFLILTFEGGSIAKLVRSEVATDERMTEEFTLVFSKLTEEYTEVKTDGKIGEKTSATYSMADNK